jgi:hypothetical protein
MKSILVTFFDNKGIVHIKFIPQGHTVNKAHYVEMLKRLREAVHRKRPKLWPNHCILHHVNAPAHNALCVKQFLAQELITEIQYLPSYPNNAPNDLWLFSKIKSALKRQRFQDTEDIKKK